MDLLSLESPFMDRFGKLYFRRLYGLFNKKDGIKIQNKLFV